MSLVPYEPFRQLTSMRKDFDRFFTDFPFAIPYAQEQHHGGIRIDVYETTNKIVVVCDLPGLEKKDDVDIDIENNRLTISGSIHQRNSKITEDKIFQRERFVGRFQRTITLPTPVSHEDVKAAYKNGVLEIKMMKLEKDQKKRINVEFH